MSEKNLEELDDEKLVERYRELSKIIGDLRSTQDNFKYQRQSLEEQDGTSEKVVEKAKENEEETKEKVREFQMELEEIKREMDDREINPVNF